MKFDITILYNYAALEVIKKENPECAEILKVFLDHDITISEATEILKRINEISERFSDKPGPPQIDPQIDPKK